MAISGDDSSRSVRAVVLGTGPGLFVRTVAVCVALANLFVQIRWWGDLEVLAGDGASPWDALPSVVLAVISGLAAAQIALWRFDLRGQDYWHRYRVTVAAFCLGGAIMGEALGWLWVLDGTLGAGTFADVLAQGPLTALGAFVYALIPGLVGAGFGLVIGLLEGLVVAFPLASILGSYGEAR